MEDQRKNERLWAEIDRNALTQNVTELEKLMPCGCSMMAVVKANAYGHGDVLVARCLNEIGVQHFAVATLDEGIHLRESGITGTILVLGYTPACSVPELLKYDLTQTAADLEHARALNEAAEKVQGHSNLTARTGSVQEHRDSTLRTGSIQERLDSTARTESVQEHLDSTARTGSVQKHLDSTARTHLKVHLKIDTGMHRLGISPERLPEIRAVLAMKHLAVTGMFTHLCAADSLEPSDVEFSRKQIFSFLALRGKLGGKCPALHIQSSYGLLNYPDLPCDFARIGIMLYGCCSDERLEVKNSPVLSPVLSLKSHIVSIHEVSPGDTVSYGRTWKADGLRRVATIPAGYADGYPRALSNKASVLLRGKYAPVAGRVCMDQMMVDVTEIPDAMPGDVVTLIGRDGTRRIPAEQVAGWAGTITNELLSRLGPRIRRIPV